MAVEVYSGRRLYFTWEANDPDIRGYTISPRINVHNNKLIFSLAAHENHRNMKTWYLYFSYDSSRTWNWHMTIYVKIWDGSLIYLNNVNVLEDDNNDYWTELWKGTRLGERSHGYIVNGSIMFVFVIDDSIECISDILQEEQTQYLCLQEFSRNMGSVLENYGYADLILRCQNEVFPVHRVILESRCRAILRRIPSKTQSITVADTDSFTLRMFLQFLYSGTVGLRSFTTAFKLYTLAQKYRMRNLRQLCASFILQNLTDDNVCAVFILADMYNDRVLLYAAVQFAAGVDNFLNSDSWIRFATQNRKLSLKLFDEILAAISPSLK